MEIVIKKNETIEELHRMSAHLGMKLSAPEYIASTAEDEEKISAMWNSAVAELMHCLLPFAQMTVSDDAVCYWLEMPANWKNEQSDNLAAQCKVFLRQALFANWLDYVKADSAMLYRTLNGNTASVIGHILSLRNKPLR